MLVGASLTAINLYGLTQDIRPTTITNDNLRFFNDHALPYSDVIAQLTKQPNETDSEFASRATIVISKGLAHIHWEKYPAETFNQRVPIWENYFLYLMSKITNIPEYKKYHFADYKRSLKRGIGVCGDASMVLSQVLAENNIENKILTYPGHVVVSANFENGTANILDADFGVAIPLHQDELTNNYKMAARLYVDNGYTAGDKAFFEKTYQAQYNEWRDVKHFITNKYYFEKISYWLKWPLPLLMIFIALVVYRKKPYVML